MSHAEEHEAHWHRERLKSLDRLIMLPIEAWHDIEEAKEAYVDMGILGRYHYDHWSQRLHTYMESLDIDSMGYTATSKTFAALIAKLEAERDEKFPETV